MPSSRKHGVSIKYVLFLILSTFFLTECTLRIYKYILDDDRVFYFNLRLAPDAAYWEQLFDKIDHDGYTQYDAELGWSIRPNSATKDSLYISNAHGFRAPKDYPITPDSTTLRIAVFGDSYTHGDQVKFEDTWPAILETTLNKHGVNCEVLNFGSGGYSMDQAYLRYLKNGKKMNPDIVVFGISLENFWRNLNLFRPNYFLYTGLPISKPRPIIKNDQLDFVNLPTVSPDSLMSLVRQESKYANILKHEKHQYNRLLTKDFPLSSFYTVKLIYSWANSAFGQNESKIKDTDEGLHIMKKIVEAFATETKKADSKFILLQIPQEYEIKSLINTGTYTNIDVLNNTFAGKNYNYCKTDSLIAQYNPSDFYNGHYAAFGHHVLGKYFADWIFENNIVREVSPNDKLVSSFSE